MVDHRELDGARLANLDLAHAATYAIGFGASAERSRSATRISPVISLCRSALKRSSSKARLRFNSAIGLTAWLDGSPVEAADTIELGVGSGLHTMTLAIDMGRRKEALSVEMTDVPGSRVGVRIIGGK